MKKSKRLGLVFITALTIFTACNNDTEKVPVQETEIRLVSEITSVSRVTSLDYQSTQIVSGQKVGITIKGAQDEHNNVAWTAGLEGTLTPDSHSIYWGDNEITVTAYHPYDADYKGTSYTFSVNTDQSTHSGYLNSDLLWATETETKTVSPITLTFAHKLAKLNVILSSDDIADLSKAVISVCGTNLSTGFNPATGDLFSVTENIADIKAGITAKDAYTASAILVPQTIGKGTQFIKINLNNKEYHYTLSNDCEFKSGHSYNCSLNIKESTGNGLAITMEDEEITDGNQYEIDAGTGTITEKNNH